jgi:hypothetical protein
MPSNTLIHFRVWAGDIAVIACRRRTTVKRTVIKDGQPTEVEVEVPNTLGTTSPNKSKVNCKTCLALLAA